MSSPNFEHRSLADIMSLFSINQSPPQHQQQQQRQMQNDHHAAFQNVDLKAMQTFQLLQQQVKIIIF